MWDLSKLELVNPETEPDKLVYSYTCPFFGATVHDRNTVRGEVRLAP